MGGSLLQGVMYVYVGVGVTAGVYLGWIDTEGFRMMGLQGVGKLEALPEISSIYWGSLGLNL